MSLKEELISVIGTECVSDDPYIIEKYSRDHSFVQPRRPKCVVYPQNTQEVQAVLKYANDHLIPVTPCSSVISFYGSGIPSQSGIVLDLTRMNRILEIDGRDRKVRVEPGVTWSQLQEELEKQSLMVCMPLLPHPSKSVLTSAMEREPILIPKSEYNEVFQSAEMVAANGEVFYTGSAVGRSHVGRNSPEYFIPSNRLFMGAQGTLGIATWANLKAEWLPVMDKLFFVAFDRIEDLVKAIYKIERRYLGSECFVLNGFNLAAILSERIEEFDSLRDILPSWTLILCLSAGVRFPEEKIEYEEEALMEIASELKFDILRTLPFVPRSDKRILSLLRKTWTKDVYWKFLYKDSCHDVFFHTTLNRVPEFTKAMDAVAIKHGYPMEDIGFYLQPIERGRITYCQYGFHCNSNNKGEVEEVRQLYLEASELAISMGGFFTTPYGSWADMVYKRAATYTMVMKVVKNAFDPNNILNPGKLCF